MYEDSKVHSEIGHSDFEVFKQATNSRNERIGQGITRGYISIKIANELQLYLVSTEGGEKQRRPFQPVGQIYLYIGRPT